MRRISGNWTSEFSTHSGRARFLPEWNRLCARSVTNGTNLGNGHGRSSLRPISQLFSDRPTNTRLAARAVCVKCAFLCGPKEEISMARKVGQIIARGDRWLETAVKPRVREKTCHDYEGVLRRYIRPNFGERVLAGMRPLGSANYVSADDERGLSARTVRYTHVVLRSALLQALHWRLLLENPADRVKLPQQPRCEMRALTLEQARTSLKAALATPYGPMLAVALTTGMRPSE